MCISYLKRLQSNDFRCLGRHIYIFSSLYHEAYLIIVWRLISCMLFYTKDKYSILTVDWLTDLFFPFSLIECTIVHHVCILPKKSTSSDVISVIYDCIIFIGLIHSHAMANLLSPRRQNWLMAIIFVLVVASSHLQKWYPENAISFYMLMFDAKVIHSNCTNKQ